MSAFAYKTSVKNANSTGTNGGVGVKNLNISYNTADKTEGTREIQIASRHKDSMASCCCCCVCTCACAVAKSDAAAPEFLSGPRVQAGWAANSPGINHSLNTDEREGEVLTGS